MRPKSKEFKKKMRKNQRAVARFAKNKSVDKAYFQTEKGIRYAQTWR